MRGTCRRRRALAATGRRRLHRAVGRGRGDRRDGGRARRRRPRRARRCGAPSRAAGGGCDERCRRSAGAAPAGCARPAAVDATGPRRGDHVGAQPGGVAAGAAARRGDARRRLRRRHPHAALRARGRRGAWQRRRRGRAGGGAPQRAAQRPRRQLRRRRACSTDCGGARRAFRLITFNAPLLRAPMVSGDRRPRHATTAPSRASRSRSIFSPPLPRHPRQRRRGAVHAQLTPAVDAALDELAARLPVLSVRFADAPDGTPHAVMVIRAPGRRAATRARAARSGLPAPRARAARGAAPRRLGRRDAAGGAVARAAPEPAVGHHRCPRPGARSASAPRPSTTPTWRSSSASAARPSPSSP